MSLTASKMPRQKYRELRSRAVEQDPCAGPADLPAFDSFLDADHCMMDVADAMTGGQQDDDSVLLTDNEALDTFLCNTGRDAINSFGQDDCPGLSPDFPLTWDNNIGNLALPTDLNNTHCFETASPMSRADSLGLTDFSLSPNSLNTPL